MATQKPLVIAAGIIKELPTGDRISLAGFVVDEDVGTFAAGDTTYNRLKTTGDGAATDATGEVSGFQPWIKGTGSEDISRLIAEYSVCEVAGSAGLTALARANFGLLYLSSAMEVTSSSVIGAGVAIEGAGGITSNLGFFVAEFLAVSGAGDVTGSIQGFLCQDVGRASATNGVSGFSCADLTGPSSGAFRAAAFSGNVTSGTGRYNLYMAGTAQNYLLGDLLIGSFIEGTEQTEPSAPASNKYRLFAKDNGSGKTQLAVRFASGSSQIIATEP